MLGGLLAGVTDASVIRSAEADAPKSARRIRFATIRRADAYAEDRFTAEAEAHGRCRRKRRLRRDRLIGSQGVSDRLRQAVQANCEVSERIGR
jgi:hypothetical protein